jgi:trehalose 6-phosphate phosphatase
MSSPEPGDAVSPPAEIALTLDVLAAAAPPLLVVADFDGTLAAGSRDPAAARIEPSARRALRRLAGIAERRPGRVAVAILTGRTVPDVAVRARVGGIEYFGDHGLQWAVLPRGARAETLVATIEPGFDAQAMPAEVLAAGVADELDRPPWLFVERKGVSVAFHVRQADDVAAAREAVLRAISAVETRAGLGAHGLMPYRGRSVVDLRPADAGGKHEAMVRLLDRHRPGGAVVLGDDLSDVDAFDAVHEAARARTLGVGIAIGVRWRLATPPEVVEQADVVLGSAVAVGGFLAALTRRLEREDR